MAERPIIRLRLAGDTVEEFQRNATELAREFFVQLDTDPVELVRIEAPFKSGAIAVRAEAIAKPATREGRAGALIRLTKLEPTSYGVAIPLTIAWPAAAEVTEIPRLDSAPVVARTTTPVPRLAVPRTTTPHVVRRVVELEAEDPVAEFSPTASITKSSPVSADLAKQLAPPPPPVAKTPAIIRRTPVAGVPPIPRPIETKIEEPPAPSLDEEWAFDAPTLGPASKPAPRKPPPVPVTPPRGTAVAPRPASKPPLDDDAAFDDAFGGLEDERATPAAPVARPAEEITKPVTMPIDPAARRTPPQPIAVVTPAAVEPVESSAPSLEQDEVPTFDPARPETRRPVAEPTRPSSEGVLATARASTLGMTDHDASATSGIAEPRPRSKRPLVLAAVIASAIVIVIVIVLLRGERTPATSSQPVIDKHLREAAARIADGKLVGRGGDAALDHLLAAKALAPDDPQVLTQLQALAETFEKLGDGALAASDLAEAATHYQAALTAQPERASAKTKLADVEARARGR